MKNHSSILRRGALFCLCGLACSLFAQDAGQMTQLPNGKLLGEVPGNPRQINNLPTAAAISPDGRFVVLVHSGYGAYTSGLKQSLTVLNVTTDELKDFPDNRLGNAARQTYFSGIAFSLDGKHLFASMASLTDPLGKNEGSTGNGIAVYRFEEGQVTPERFTALAPRASVPAGKKRRAEYADVTYPAGLCIGRSGGEERLLVASNNSDEAILLNTADGKIVHRFDLSTFRQIPASLPYMTAMTNDGKRGFVSLWNSSTVAELDLAKGRVRRMIALRKPQSPLTGGSHPTALLLNADDSRLFVALTDRDEIAVVNTANGKPIAYLSTKLPGQQYGGSDPEYLALSPDGKTLFSANAISDSVAVFNLAKLSPGATLQAAGFIPTDWYPTLVAATANDLLIASAKGRGSGPNPKEIGKTKAGRPQFPYGPAMIHGSLARLALADLPAKLDAYTKQVSEMNAARGNGDRVPFASGENKIHHVIYIIKENRTYDQVFGDISGANGDPSLAMYGEDITPNQHKLARQFGILDNFYDSGDVSGDGHVWSTSASISDYVAKTWPVGYRSKEHTYDSEGTLLGGISVEDEVPDAGEPTGGYLWRNFASHGVTYRHYGEYIVSRWCNAPEGENSPQSGPPKVKGDTCSRTFVKKGEPLANNVGDPRGGPSPYPWAIPVLAKNIAAEAELRGHFDPLFPDFEVAYPDQLRVDEFLNEFDKFVASRKAGQDTMPQFILLRLPNDHTAGGRKDQPKPAASVADNDLAVGRAVDAVSHSPYWDDTAFLILEDDAQNGPDHVDSHRSIALVISKYSPGESKSSPSTSEAAPGSSEGRESKDAPSTESPSESGRSTSENQDAPATVENRPSYTSNAAAAGGAFIDHSFYTTINVVRTIEALLGVPPMNANDSRAAVMAPLFSGSGQQPPFTADYRNRDNGLIYEMNTGEWKQGQKLDFSHADAVDSALLNEFLWHDRMGNTPMPPPQHNIFPAAPPSPAGRPSKRDLD
jgi:Lactonase, 7-bladed beta-propeller